MNDIQLIERVLEAHEIPLVITGPLGGETRLTVSVPDLRSAPRSVWGDWGPMYTVTMPPDRRIDVSVWNPASPAPLREALGLTCLEIESPALATTREVTPLMMRIPLPSANAILHVFYDTRGRAARVELAPTPETGGHGGLYRLAMAEGPLLPTATVGSDE